MPFPDTFVTALNVTHLNARTDNMILDFFDVVCKITLWPLSYLALVVDSER